MINEAESSIKCSERMTYEHDRLYWCMNTIAYSLLTIAKLMAGEEAKDDV